MKTKKPKEDINERKTKALKGERIKLVEMGEDPDPIPPETKGTVECVDDSGVIHVNWDNGRKLGVIPNVDSYELLR